MANKFMKRCSSLLVIIEMFKLNITVKKKYFRNSDVIKGYQG